MCKTDRKIQRYRAKHLDRCCWICAQIFVLLVSVKFKVFSLVSWILLCFIWILTQKNRPKAWKKKAKLWNYFRNAVPSAVGCLMMRIESWSKLKIKDHSEVISGILYAVIRWVHSVDQQRMENCKVKFN